MSKAMGSRYSVESSRESREYFEFVKDLLDHEVVGEMKKFRHHYSTTCYQHCLNVSYYNYIVCKKLGLNAKAAARAGMLHDLFLYDWRDEPRERGELPHGFTHPRKALNNAKKHFELDKMEEDMILKHMFPLTVIPPKYAESYVIVMIDKYAALLEFGVHCKNVVHNTVHSLHKHRKSA